MYFIDKHFSFSLYSRCVRPDRDGAPASFSRENPTGSDDQQAGQVYL